MAFYETSLDNEIGLFLIDVNGLKEMNDKMGHAAGDALLKTVAERLKKVFAKRSASLYRIGGDEFIAILEQDELDNGTAILEELIAAQDDPVAMMNKRSSGIVATFAVGFADSRKVPFEMLYKHADAEMYARKEAYYKMRQEKFGEIRKPRH
jgi:two-component system CheB/CheR fusion protein